MPSPRELIFKSRIVAIVRLDDLKRSKELVSTLLDAGIRCIEFTLTNPETPFWIERLLAEEPRFQDATACLGLGSVRKVSEAELAVRCGAQFVVTPIASGSIVKVCKEHGVPIAAGAYSPTEISAMWDAGADLVKVFPIKHLGPSYLRDVLAPMPYLKLLPTGGIDFTNAREYLRSGAAAVGVGGSLCRADWVDQGRWDAVREAATQLVQSVSE